MHGMTAVFTDASKEVPFGGENPVPDEIGPTSAKTRHASILWGVLPGQPGVSWEAHLFGAIAGAAAALLVRTHVHAPRLGGVDLD